MRKLFYTLILALSASFGITSCVDDDNVTDSYYTFTGEMVTDYLENRSAEFSDFISLVKRARLWDLLSTYGEFTCFAPTNDAIRDYLRVNNLSSIDQISDAVCDTLVWQHLVKTSYFTTDLQEGSLPMTNMNNRYLVFSCDTIDGHAKYFMNANSEMIARDDSVENGVVHTLATVLSMSSTFLGDAIVNNDRCKIFGEALRLTGLKDTLSLFMDMNYHCSVDSTSVNSTSPHHRVFGGHDVYWRYPQQRRLMWTVFVETDSIFKLKGIETIDDLKKYAKKIYDNTYPEDAGLYDTDWTNRRNPLNRFIAYHILDRYASYSEMTVSNSVWGSTIDQFLTEYQDIMEFYETVCPFTLLKVCDAAGDKWVNRRGVGNNRVAVRGCRILPPSEAGHSTDELNGLYHYIDDILVYDKENTIGKVLNCRMRFDATTLSPDFMNAGARNADPKAYTGVDYYMTAFKPGFTKNFIFSDKTFFAVHNRFWCLSWENDMCACLDNFDFKFRIPPVPAGETYEIRLGYVAGGDRGVVQIYMDDNGTGDVPCGIPLDLRQYGGYYGWVSDADLNNDPAEIEANDKALRNQGFMKGQAGATFPDGNLARDNNGNLRRILATQYIEPEHSYYLRMRQVLENLAEFSFDYIEVVPKSVYDGIKGEDKY